MLPARSRGTPPAGAKHRAATALLLGALATISIQVQVRPGLRLSPSDAFVLALLIFQPAALLRGLGRIGAAPILFFIALLGGCLTAELKGAEGIATYTLINKVAGLVLLLALCAALLDWPEICPPVSQLASLWLAGPVAALNALMLILHFGLGLNNILSLTIHDEGRLQGLLYDPNAYGTLLVVAIGLLVAQAPNGRGIKLIRLSVLCSLHLSVYLTHSRGALLALAACWALLLLHRVLTVRQLCGVTLAALSVLLVLYATSTTMAIEVASADRPDTIGQRMDLILAGLREFYSAPIFGGGLGSFISENSLIVHNTLVWLLADLGLTGAIPFVWIALGRSTGTTKRALLDGERSPLLGVSAGLWAMWMASMTFEASYQRHWWALFGLAGLHQTAAQQGGISRAVRGNST